MISKGARMRLALALVAALASAVAVQSQRAPIRTCDWYAYDAKVPVAGYCHMNQYYLLAISAQPTTYIGKALTRVYGRSYACAALTNEKACRAKYGAWGCVWGGSADASKPKAFCSSIEQTQWQYFTTHPYTFGVPTWMRCASSQARRALECSASNPNATACAALPGCVYVKGRSCVAKFQEKYTDAQWAAWYDKLNANDPAVVGSCPSQCYLQRVTNCSAGSAKLSKPEAEKWCKARQDSCTWDGSVCAANLYGNDAWGKEANRASSFCATFSKDNTTCLTKTPRSAVINTQRVQQLINYPSAADARPVQCKL